MALLDRLLPPWRHSDPEIRASAVRELGRDSPDVLASIARDDSEARVRRIAIRRLDDTDLLLEIGRTDVDEDLRALATTRAEELLVERALSDRPPEDCLDALGAISRPTHRVTIATRAVHPSVRRAALSGLTDERALADVARRGDDPEIGLEALTRVSDPILLHRVVGGAPVDVALAALERIQDPEVLQAIADDHQGHKGVRKRARAMLDAVLTDDHPIRAAARHERQVELCAAVEEVTDVPDPVAALTLLRDAEREWEDLSARTVADPAVAQRFRHACTAVRDAIARVEREHAEELRREAAHEHRLAVQQQICERVEALQGAGTPQALEAAQAEWEALGPNDDTQGLDLSARFAADVERCTQRYERWRVRNDFRAGLEALVKDAERLVASGDPHAAAHPRAALEKRWEQLASSPAGTKWLGDERGLQQRFVEAGEALQQQARSMRAEGQQRQREARNRSQALCHRLEQLAQADAVTRAAADRALAADAEEHLRALPPAERETLRQRLTVARQALEQRVEESARAEEWKRWANRDVQQRLIERAEALLAADDPRPILKELGRLEREWKTYADAPRDESQALWDRFRNARNQLRRRATAYLADNLAKKEALCVAAEQLADSTEWNSTAAAIREMQEEWKRIGPVRQKLSAALFERFRAPANRFFERQKEFHQARKEKRNEMLGRMRALCEAAEGLVESTDWDTTAAEIKRLQLQARDVWGRGAPKRREREAARPGDVLRERFGAACDGFFERYRRRDELEREAKLAAAESVVAELESLVAALAEPEPPTTEDITARLKESLAGWTRISSIPSQQDHPLAVRVQAACDAIEAAYPEGLPESELGLDGSVRAREKLCARLEQLAASLAAEAGEPSPSDLAEKLKLALAARTIGGTAATPREQMRQDTIDAAERLKGKWRKLGPIIGNRARALALRFEKAAGEVKEAAEAVS